MDCFNPILQVTLGWLPYVSHNIYWSGEVRLLQFTQYIWWVIPMNIVYPMDVDPHIVASYKCILFQELTFSWVHTSYSYSKSLVVSVSTVIHKEYRLPWNLPSWPHPWHLWHDFHGMSTRATMRPASSRVKEWRLVPPPTTFDLYICITYTYMYFILIYIISYWFILCMFQCRHPQHCQVQTHPCNETWHTSCARSPPGFIKASVDLGVRRTSRGP